MLKLPPGVKLGKDGKPGSVISNSEWPEGVQFHGEDERAEGEAIQPGDLVIEIRNKRPVVYTHPERGRSGSVSQSTTTSRSNP